MIGLAINWDYEDLSAKEFLNKAFVRAKRLNALKSKLSVVNCKRKRRTNDDSISCTYSFSCKRL